MTLSFRLYWSNFLKNYMIEHLVVYILKIGGFKGATRSYRFKINGLHKQVTSNQKRIFNDF